MQRQAVERNSDAQAFGLSTPHEQIERAPAAEKKIKIFGSAACLFTYNFSHFSL